MEKLARRSLWVNKPEQGSNIIFPAASDMCHGRDRSLYDVTQIPYG